MTREDLVSILRVSAIGRIESPMALEPDEYVLEATRRAYERGHADGQAVGSALYPEGG